jgi:PiT family inorganic phosphate transporter
MPEASQAPLVAVAAVVILAIVFDFLNGFHDSANSIATVVSTRVLSPRTAVIWAAAFNFVAFFVFSHGVAATIGKGVVDASRVTVALVAAGLIAAIAWNLATWYYGLPSSSSHTLIGGFAGAAVAKGGFGMLIAPGLLKIIAFIVIAPMLGLGLGYLMMAAVYWTFRRTQPAHIAGLFKRLQLVSAAAYSLGHGGNDAQKTMGIILAVLIAGRYSAPDASLPNWVALSCYAAMALGTLFGGWRIVKTMGQRLAHLQPVHGFCAETSGAVSIFLATALNIPVSTTHVITGSIFGVGLTRGVHAVKWIVARRVAAAWLLTIPVSAFIGGVLYPLLALVIKF